MPSTPGMLIAFEGLDQSGKQTQAEAVRHDITSRSIPARLLSFPDYATPIGAELHRALHGEREYPPDVMQLCTSPTVMKLARICRHPWPPGRRSSAIAMRHPASLMVKRRDSTPRG